MCIRDSYYADHLWDNGKRVELTDNYDGGFGTYTQDLIHERGLQFLDKNKDKPFFLFLPYVLPHAELIVPEDSIKKVTPPKKSSSVPVSISN